MGKKLYVGNLTYDVDSSSLQQLFSAHGNVISAEVIADRETGRSKGFGFVEMSSEDEAQAAINGGKGRGPDSGCGGVPSCLLTTARMRRRSPVAGENER